MRDILEDLFGNEPIDPTESARRNMRPKLRERFYRHARRRRRPRRSRSCSTARPVKTPAGGALALPSRALAEAIAAEWERKASASIPPPCR